MAKTKKAKKDWDGDGKVESGSEEYMGVKDKAIKKAVGKKTKKKVVKESADIKGFIAAISGKKYALANKYLKAVINSKIQNRISSSLNEPLF